MKNSPTKKLIGILGGSFDPIHYGHLRIALEIQQNLNLSEVRFIPCRKPVHKNSLRATPEQRLHMLRLAIGNQPGFVIDEREIHRTTPSYMVLTLESLRQECKHQPLCLIVGNEILASLHQWYRWQELIHLCHFIIVNRWHENPNVSPEVNLLIQKHQTDQLELLQNTSNGYILFKPTTVLEISATQIRQEIAEHKNPSYLLPDNVLEYIKKERLY